MKDSLYKNLINIIFYIVIKEVFVFSNVYSFNSSLNIINKINN